MTAKSKPEINKSMLSDAQERIIISRIENGQEEENKQICMN